VAGIIVTFEYHKIKYIAFCRNHGVVGFELLDSIFLLYSTRDTVGGIDMRRGIHDRSKNHKITLERMQLVS